MKTRERGWRVTLVGGVMLGTSLAATSTTLHGQRTGISTYGLTAADQIRMDDKDPFLMVHSEDQTLKQALQDEMEPFLESLLVSKAGNILVHHVDSTTSFLDEALGIMRGLPKRSIVLATAAASRSTEGVELVFKLFRVDVKRTPDERIEIASVELIFSDRCKGKDLRSAIVAPRLALSLCRNPHVSEKSWTGGVRSPEEAVGKSVSVE